ncbi:twin-arginine translocation signal domain-containing protein [Arthrobacter sp. CDRTa11]|nr:twin-arginine translocation signal domain-containing protein [Arthrobacter sp. CDRTa11]
MRMNTMSTNFNGSDNTALGTGAAPITLPDQGVSRRNLIKLTGAGAGAGGGPPHGRREGTERQPLRHQNGRAGLRHALLRPLLLGRKRRQAGQRRLARHLCRRLQRRGGLPALAGLR